MLEERLDYLKRLTTFVFARFSADGCASIAAQLTVTSLLALVPMTAVGFTLLSLIPSFQNLGDELQTLLFSYFAPQTGEIVQGYLGEFVGKAQGLSGAGGIMLFLTALMMMRTIDSSFNRIWHSSKNHSAIRTFLVYWAVLTLGPILLGSSLLVTSYVKSLPLVSEVVDNFSAWFTHVLPLAMEIGAFLVLFMLVPNRKIRWSHALISALLTTLMFELAKAGFTVFVKSFSTYQLIFGALATLPLFLIWIYISWLVLLFGAEFCHGLEAVRKNESKTSLAPMIEILSLLELLSRAQLEGGEINEALLEQKLVFETDNALTWLNRMTEAGWLAKTENQSWCLKIAVDKLDLWKVFELAGFRYPSHQQLTATEVSPRISEKLNALAKEIQNRMQKMPVTCDNNEDTVRL